MRCECIEGSLGMEPPPDNGYKGAFMPPRPRRVETVREWPALRGAGSRSPEWSYPSIRQPVTR